MITLQPQRIPADSIGCDYPWSLHQDLPPELAPDFIGSIKRYGILHPPILRRQGQKVFEPVCGARRLRAAVQVLQQNEIDCLVLPENIASGAILQLVLEDQRSGSPLSPLQTGRFRRLCREHLDDSRAREIERSAALGSRVQLDRLAGLVDLEQEFREGLHHGLISVQVGLELRPLRREERLLLLELFGKLGLNHNKQRRVMELGRTVMAIEDIPSYVELLNDLCPTLAGRNDVANPPQAAQHLLLELQQRSSPMSSAAEQRFAALVAELDLPDNCLLKHAKSFEQDSVTLEIRFRNIQEFRDRWASLQDHVPDD